MDARTAATLPTPAAGAPAAAATDASSASSKPKPCCVCKDEKSRRDECMLFSNAKDPAADCKSLVDQYKTCMLGYGFKV
ncbi:Cytochrome c oxidase copper chaperone [Purpureocillium takamizusanense]|uniref:Cytochrome c oxidase copper chaperone n=1 Tax=Purpureocillium takamizusanense TaxID=2060973 RepID=A0A9Q8Q9P0_9HYPO|nr:Cytochrome c oxidase copper chaperone [Purpureocillium takamizusanense]UNI14917.1 Cytochrome c oxidase copper chaperone [Purpureocillium takamizusanense]